MSFNTPDDGDENFLADINVTPLVDVMLVLLIVFMITMPVLFTRMELDFPTTNEYKEVGSNREPLMIKVTVDKEGKYYLEDKDISKNDLIAHVRLRLSNDEEKKNTVFALNAEKETSYGVLIDLVEIIQKAGGRKIGYMQEIK